MRILLCDKTGEINAGTEKDIEGDVLYERVYMGGNYKGPPMYQEVTDWRKELIVVAEEIREEMAKIVEIFPHPLISRKAKLIRSTKFEWSSEPKMHKATGMALIEVQIVRLSEPYFSVPKNVEIEFRETILHEICHIACPMDLRHGKTWQQLNTAVGGNGSVCHTLELKG